MLVYDGWTPRKTHDLSILLDAVVVPFPQLEELRDSAELLTPYATAFRYPGDLSDPSNKEFAEALAAADEILAAAMNLTV